jgi:hypothetical protein
MDTDTPDMGGSPWRSDRMARSVVPGRPTRSPRSRRCRGRSGSCTRRGPSGGPAWLSSLDGADGRDSGDWPPGRSRRGPSARRGPRRRPVVRRGGSHLLASTGRPGAAAGAAPGASASRSRTRAARWSRPRRRRSAPGGRSLAGSPGRGALSRSRLVLAVQQPLDGGGREHAGADNDACDD